MAVNERAHHRHVGDRVFNAVHQGHFDCVVLFWYYCGPSLGCYGQVIKAISRRFSGHFPGEPGLAGVY